MEYYTLGGFLSGLFIIRLISWLCRIIKRFVWGGISIGINMIKSSVAFIQKRR